MSWGWDSMGSGSSWFPIIQTGSLFKHPRFLPGRPTVPLGCQGKRWVGSSRLPDNSFTEHTIYTNGNSNLVNPFYSVTSSTVQRYKHTNVSGRTVSNSEKLYAFSTSIYRTMVIKDDSTSMLQKLKQLLKTM